MKSIQNEMTLPHLYRQFSKNYPLSKATTGSIHTWHWIDTGSGKKTLLMLPGFLGEAETSFLFINALSNNTRVISVSLPQSIHNVKDFCNNLIEFLEMNHANDVTILGGSSGGFLAQSFVRNCPDQISNIILTHTGLPNKKWANSAQTILYIINKLPFIIIRTLFHLSVYFYFPFFTESHRFWRRHFQNVIHRHSQESLHNRFSLMCDFHENSSFSPNDLKDWKGKILIMEMLKDRLTTTQERSALLEMYPQATIHSFVKTSHFDSVENPEEQIEVIRKFVMRSK